jgi:hypothetical protein
LAEPKNAQTLEIRKASQRLLITIVHIQTEPPSVYVGRDPETLYIGKFVHGGLWSANAYL